jgi:hypothetical protein
MTGPRLSLEGRSLRMVRTGIPVSVGPRLGEGAQGVVHQAAFRGFPPLLELPGGTVVLSDGAVIAARHLRRDCDYETVVAVVEPHPASPGWMVLRNAGPRPWTMRPDSESATMVEPGRRLAVRTMTIDFGSARGRILGS